MKQIPYFRDGQVVVFENSEGIPLRYGLWTWNNARWVVSEDVFTAVRQQNPDVEFIEIAR